MESIQYVLADNHYRFPVAERLEGGVQGRILKQRESNGDNEWLASTVLSGGCNPTVYLHQILSLGE
jgi:hypothetical protein